jgi:hypothetical protein
LQCPVCNKTRVQKIPPFLTEKRYQIDKGVCGILIPEKIVCEHGFIVYMDMNFSVRDVISLDQAQELNMRKLIQLKSIEDIVVKLNSESIKNLLQKL